MVAKDVLKKRATGLGLADDVSASIAGTSGLPNSAGVAVIKTARRVNTCAERLMGFFSNVEDGGRREFQRAKIAADALGMDHSGKDGRESFRTMINSKFGQQITIQTSNC